MDKLTRIQWQSATLSLSDLNKQAANPNLNLFFTVSAVSFAFALGCELYPWLCEDFLEYLCVFLPLLFVFFARRLLLLLLFVCVSAVFFTVGFLGFLLLACIFSIVDLTAMSLIVFAFDVSSFIEFDVSLCVLAIAGFLHRLQWSVSYLLLFLFLFLLEMRATLRSNHLEALEKIKVLVALGDRSLTSPCSVRQART